MKIKTTYKNGLYYFESNQEAINFIYKDLNEKIIDFINTYVNNYMRVKFPEMFIDYMIEQFGSVGIKVNEKQIMKVFYD